MLNPTSGRWIACVVAVALAAVGAVTTAGSAAAYPTTTPAWVAGDTARNGEIFIYDASGAQLTGGTDYNVLGQFFAGQTTAKTTNATLANLNISFPDATNAVPSTWFTTNLQASTAFSTQANRPTAVGPVINKNNWPAGSTPIADTLTGGTLSTATNYQNVFELRMTNSGPGGVNGAGKYWAVDIEFNPAAVGGATFDGLAPQAWRVLQATPSLPTTTSITSVTPASQNVAGGTTGSVTAVAAVSPAAAAGTVQFKVDGVNSGSPVAVASGSATATLTGLTGSLTPGTGHVVTAAFTATTPAANTVGYGDSASTNTAVNATIVWNAADATATNLALSSSNVNYGVDTLTATATVTDTTTPATAVNVGSVQFKVDGVNSGSPVTVSASGVATYTVPTGTLAASSTPGTAHTVTAVYTDGNTFNTSTSANATFNLIQSYAQDPQNIQTSITAGTLVISTPYTSTSPLVLPAMALNATATEYATSAAFTGISVADTRPGNLPYTLSAISTNLTKNGVLTPGVNETINAQNVGLNISSLTSTNATPNTFLGSQNPGTATTGQNFTGFNNAAAAHLAAGAAGSAGLGGASPHVVLHANSGLGTTVTAGTLSITAPSNTLDGTYAGVITFSIIGS